MKRSQFPWMGSASFHGQDPVLIRKTLKSSFVAAACLGSAEWSGSDPTPHALCGKPDLFYCIKKNMTAKQMQNSTTQSGASPNKVECFLQTPLDIFLKTWDQDVSP